MAAGHGVLVIEPSGDLVQDVLDRVPAHRLNDVVILNPADEARPVGLNVLSASEADREMAKESGFHDFIAKPYDPQSLLRRLAALKPLTG